MKLRIIFHYFLFLAIVLGAFASMAQNNYGLTVISWACFLFAASLLLELIQRFSKLTWDKALELAGLTLLMILFGLRSAYLHFGFVELVLILSSGLLMIVYLVHAIGKIKQAGKDNARLRNLIIIYYGSLLGFTLAIILTFFAPGMSELLGGLSAGLLAIFIAGLSLSGKRLINGVEVKTSDYLRKNVGHSIILMTGFLLISIYTGLHMFGLLPALYTNNIPQTYIELINDAETGKESPENGVYRHEVYKKAYDEFMEAYVKDE